MRFVFSMLLLLIILSSGCTADVSKDHDVTSAPETPIPQIPVSISTTTPIPAFPAPIHPFPGYAERSTQAIYPKIIPDVPEGIESIVISYQFPFKTDSVQIHIPVDISVYQGAHRATKDITVLGPTPPPTLIRDYYLSFVGDPQQDEFFKTLLGALREYRIAWNLTDDEYLELLSTGIQSLPYRPHEGGSKFPVETFVDGYGDCDDKALLLAGLLAREDYNISLLYFEEEHHVALGVAATAHTFQNSEYAYIETTRPSFIGSVPETIEENRIHFTAPLLVRIGNGIKVYKSSEGPTD